MKATKETQEKDFLSITERFKFNKYFSEQDKIDKFNNLITEYNRLINYRYSLQVSISNKNIVFDTTIMKDNEEVFVSRRKKMNNEQIIAFQNEINSLNIIISWIEVVILGEPNLLSKYKNEDTNTDSKED